MAEKIVTVTVKNESKGTRFLTNSDGHGKSVAADAELGPIQITEAELKSQQSRGDLRITVAKGKAAEPAPGPKDDAKPLGSGELRDGEERTAAPVEGETADRQPPEEPSGPRKAVRIAHEGFGKWFGYDDADAKVTDEMSKAEAHKYAVTNELPDQTAK